MFAFVGGTNRPKKTLQAAVLSLRDGVGGAKAIYDTETGDLYALDGQPLHTLLPHQYEKVVSVLGLAAITSMTNLPYPKAAVAASLAGLGGQLLQDVSAYGKAVLKELRKKVPDGDSATTGE